MTDKLTPLLGATPVLLFLYGLAGQNVIYVSAYLRALDSFFFYLGFAALVAAANRYLVRRLA